MTPAFGSMLIFGAVLTLTTAILNLSDGSYLISSATRPPRLKHHVDYSENGTPTESNGQKSFRQSPIRDLSNQPINHNEAQKSWSFDKKHNFFNALKPVARNFLLKNHHGHLAAPVTRDKRKPYLPEDESYSYDDIYSQNDIPDIGENVIEENPKSSKNFNYYPYRGKRPFEVPQIGKSFVFL